jgi:hypothetical protein
VQICNVRFKATFAPRLSLRPVVGPETSLAFLRRGPTLPRSGIPLNALMARTAGRRRLSISIVLSAAGRSRLGRESWQAVASGVST